jgi:hypothetical protein
VNPTEEVVQDILVQYGAKGMHRGIRKEEKTSGQKPASPKISTKKEQRAKGHESNAHKAQIAADQIRANPSRWSHVQKGRNNQINQLEKYRDQQIKAAKDVRAGHMTDTQKKILIGAGVAATVLAAYGTYKLVDSGSLHQFKTKDIPFKKSDLLSRKMSSEAIMKEVVKPINPGYGEIGTKTNCRRATFAYEMRRRGLDVRSTRSVAGTGQTVAGVLNATHPGMDLGTGKSSMVRTLSKESKDTSGRIGPLTLAVKIAGGTGKEPIGKWGPFEKGSLERSKTIFDAIGEHPEGARGELGLRWYNGSAHSMAWEKIHGKVHIFDAQQGIKYNVDSFASDVTSNIQEVGMTRLDDMKLNHGFLRKWVTNVK